MEIKSSRRRQDKTSSEEINVVILREQLVAQPHILVEGGHVSQIFVCQFEVKDVHVLLLVFEARSFWDHGVTLAEAPV